VKLPADYPSLLDELDAWHAGAQQRYPGIIPCRPGCAACCHGPFDISMADALLVRDTVAALPPEVRAGVTARAEAQLARMQSSEPGLTAPFDVSALGEGRFDALTERFSEEPCPALDEGSRCVIYEGRPMVCRLMGLGLETDLGETIENDCPIQSEFPAYAALPPQPFDLTAFEAGEALALAGAAEVLFGRDSSTDYETTVAGAIMLSSP
jgi:Fe-S-cluster containining protein